MSHVASILHNWNSGTVIIVGYILSTVTLCARHPCVFSIITTQSHSEIKPSVLEHKINIPQLTIQNDKSLKTHLQPSSDNNS